MKNHIEMFRALLNGDVLTNKDYPSDKIMIVDGNVHKIDEFGVNFPIKWMDASEWAEESKA